MILQSQDRTYSRGAHCQEKIVSQWFFDRKLKHFFFQVIHKVSPERQGELWAVSKMYIHMVNVTSYKINYNIVHIAG